MCTENALINRFITSAEAVSAVVVRVDGMPAALNYTVDLCARKEACQLLVSGCDEPLSDDAEQFCLQKQPRIMAAPNLPPAAHAELKHRCTDRGIVLTENSLRDHLAGIDIGLTLADYGIAETGTLVIDSRREAVRLATMISEIHLAILPVSRIYPTAEAMEVELRSMMQAAPGYLAFVTGASRTADIERVLAIGVHGPLELHIVLMEEA
jgi:L-lactate dehydrogenase complex protein LldG